MKPSFGRTAPLSVVALALAALIAACSGGGGEAGSGDSTAAAQPGMLRTIVAWAGSPDPGGAAYRDGTGSAARFEQMQGVTVASDGSVWVTEPEAQRIRRIDEQGKVSTALDVTALAPWTDAAGRGVHFLRPHALAAGPSGEVFVAVDQYTQTPGGPYPVDARWAVLRIAPGAPAVVAMLPASETENTGNGVSGMALDRQGRLVIGDRGCTVWRTDGEVLSVSQPRAAVLVHSTGVIRPGRACGMEALTRGITRLALDLEDRVLFTFVGGEAQRIEADGRITVLGRTPISGSFLPVCGGMLVDRAGRLLLGGSSALMHLDAAGGEQVVAGAARESGRSDGTASSARFGAVCGMALDREGRIVLIDGPNHTVRRIDRDGSVTTLAGLAPQVGYRDGTGADALFHHLLAVGPGTGADVVVADPNNRTVRQVDARQRVSTLVGMPEEEWRFDGVDGPVATARLVAPMSALKSADGSLWIADRRALRRLGSDGMVSTLALRDGSGDLAEAMALDRSGDVLVVSSTYLGGPNGLLLSRPYFERYSSSRPHASPQRLEASVSHDLQARLFGQVNGLCVLQDGTFAFTQGHAVLHRAADGKVALLAGSPDETGDQDGEATSARFRDPAGLACDAAGGLYVADSGNHTVRYVDAQRSVRTVLGTPGQAGSRIDALPGELHAPRSLVLVPGGLVVATGLGLVRAGF
jgi:sugar lactone lactonase YvrE